MPVNLMEKPATVDDVFREVSRIKSIVTEAVDDGVQSALRGIKQGRFAAEDAIHDARRAVKQNPLQAVGVCFAAGVLTGCLVVWASMRRS
ncbi:MAG TPA: hypothetical protein VL967_09065 [Terracidiphilus sp.]|nr:hypothetical protein [Terracidiphilus sp.]